MTKRMRTHVFLQRELLQLEFTIWRKWALIVRIEIDLWLKYQETFTRNFIYSKQIQMESRITTHLAPAPAIIQNECVWTFHSRLEEHLSVDTQEYRNIIQNIFTQYLHRINNKPYLSGIKYIFQVVV